MRTATLIVLASLLLAAAAAAQQVYRWVDEDGVVHYSDQPPPDDGAETIDIEVPPGIDNPTRAIAASEPPRAPRRRGADDGQTETVGGYRMAAIVEPEAEQVLWNIATRLQVAMTLEPALAGSHQVQWLLDGEPIGEPVSSLRTTLEPVYRGTHTLTATVVNAEGRTVYSTDPLTFYVQQATVFRR